MMLRSLWLRLICFLLLCGLLSFILFFLIAWFIALFQVLCAMATLLGGPSG